MFSVKAYDIIKKTYGKSNDQTAVALKNVGIMYFENDEFVKAEKIFKKVLEMMKEIYGEDYATLQGDFEKVTELREQCLEHMS